MLAQRAESSRWRRPLGNRERAMKASLWFSAALIAFAAVAFSFAETDSTGPEFDRDIALPATTRHRSLADSAWNRSSRFFMAA